jgi:hypothetical protein
MRRFEIWELTSRDKNGATRLVMILQSEKIHHLNSIIVAPLKAASSDMVEPDLTLNIDVKGLAFTVLVPLMTAIDRRQLSAFVCDGSVIDDEIAKAMDRVFSGI